MKKIILIPAICIIFLFGFSDSAFGDCMSEWATFPEEDFSGYEEPMDYGTYSDEFSGYETPMADQQAQYDLYQGIDDAEANRLQQQQAWEGGNGGGGGGDGEAAEPDFSGKSDFYKYGNGDYSWQAQDKNWYSFDKSTGNFYEVMDPNALDITNPVGSDGGAGSNPDISGVRNLVGTDQDGLPIYKEEGTGNYYELGANGFTNAEGSDMAITPLAASEQAAMSASSSNSSGRISVPQSDGSLATAVKGSDGNWNYMNDDGSQGAAVNWSNVSSAASSSQWQIGQGSATSFTPAQIITGPDGKLYQKSGSAMVPYTGSAATGGYMGSSGGYMGSGGGIFGTLGSAVGSVVGGVGSAVGSLIGGVLGLGGSSNGGYYGTTGYGGVGGYGTSGGYYGSPSGYGTTAGGYYGSPVGGYSALGSPVSTAGGAGGWNPSRYASTGLPVSSIYSIVQNIVMWALSIFGFIGIIGFVISGVWYLLSAGDDTSMKKAKNAMTYSIIGVVVGLVGLVVIFAANSLLRGSSFF